MTEPWVSMNPKWHALMAKAKPFVDFLQRGDFLARPYWGAPEVLLITDGAQAVHLLTEQDSDDFPAWDEVKKTQLNLPASWESLSFIDHHLAKLDHFNLYQGDFHGALGKVVCPRDGVELLRDDMAGDIRMILQCYANDFFPPIWQQILHVYLHDGFLCGWSAQPPAGQLVVFLNS